mmetsp:Transcript_5995/g.15259  ORF Transcript_5995/g.15259 Transcript_5995/m.15259 type:complete len:307 (-) Transcript_5995:162-1082(-)
MRIVYSECSGWSVVAEFCLLLPQDENAHQPQGQRCEFRVGESRLGRCHLDQLLAAGVAVDGHPEVSVLIPVPECRSHRNHREAQRKVPEHLHRLCPNRSASKRSATGGIPFRVVEVKDDGASSPFEHAADLPKAPRPVSHVAQAVPECHAIEGPVRKRQGQRIPVDPIDGRRSQSNPSPGITRPFPSPSRQLPDCIPFGIAAPFPLLGPLEHILGEIQCGHFTRGTHTTGQSEGQITTSAANIEGFVPALCPRELHHLVLPCPVQSDAERVVEEIVRGCDVSEDLLPRGRFATRRECILKKVASRR